MCEVRQVEPIQQFNPIQATIATITTVALVIGIYLFLAKTESKTFFGQFLHELVLTKEQLKKEQDAKFAEQLDREFENDDF